MISSGTNSPSALSLFSGAGGMDIGVRAAGFNVLACIENDPFCCKTLRAAVERESLDTRIIESDIRTVSPGELLENLGLQAGVLDLLFGGPPCQAFSLAGKQKSLEDERGVLLFQIIRFAQVFSPKVILLEQVKGLLSAKGLNGKRGEVFEFFVSQLKAEGYISKWKIMLAADYGIPQLRERVFLVATKGKNGFKFPDPTHAPSYSCNNLFPLQPYVTVGEAISGLNSPLCKQRGQTFFDRNDSHVDVTPDRDRERISQVPEGSHLAAQKHLGENLRRGLTKKDTTKYLRMHKARPANTLRCGEIFYHPTENRYLTPRECMRIHGYPDNYELKGPIRSRTGSVRNLDQHRQVANSVPPPLAEMLANQIRSFLHESYI